MYHLKDFGLQIFVKPMYFICKNWVIYRGNSVLFFVVPFLIHARRSVSSFLCVNHINAVFSLGISQGMLILMLNLYILKLS